MRPTTRVREALVAQTLGPSTSRITVGSSLLGVSADLVIELDADECSRRAIAHAGRLDDLDTLMFLMGLPHHEPVPIATLSADEHLMLGRAPSGSVEVRGKCVVRLACPPTRSVLALVYADDWLHGLRSTSVFAPVATRMLILPTLPPDAATLLATAAEYGIGVGTLCTTGGTIHLQPEIWRQRFFTPGGWLFREEVFQLAAQAGVSESPETAQLIAVSPHTTATRKSL